LVGIQSSHLPPLCLPEEFVGQDRCIDGALSTFWPGACSFGLFAQSRISGRRHLVLRFGRAHRPGFGRLLPQLSGASCLLYIFFHLGPFLALFLSQVSSLVIRTLDDIRHAVQPDDLKFQV